MSAAAPVAWFDGSTFTDNAAAIACLAAEFDGWAPALIALIAGSETAPVPRWLHALPDGYQWEQVPGVTLLGGDGANLAMLDGAELARAVAASPDDIEVAIAVYELFPCSKAAATDARQIMDVCFGERAPLAFLELVTGPLDGSHKRAA